MYQRRRPVARPGAAARALAPLTLLGSPRIIAVLNMIIRSVSFAFERRRMTDDDARGILTLDDRQDTRTPRLSREWPDHPLRRHDDPPSRDLKSQ